MLDRLNQLSIDVARLEEQNKAAEPLHELQGHLLSDLREWKAGMDEWRRALDTKIDPLVERIVRLERHNGNGRRRQYATVGGTGSLTVAAVYLAQWLSRL